LHLLLLPLGILAFLIFLLFVGAFGLFCATVVIGSVGWVFGKLTGRGRRRREAGAPAVQSPAIATRRRLFFWR
jgi:hypothetical protein